MDNGLENIRNFLITAHIDHGKSTLADRLLEVTGTIEKRQMKPQYLDQLELERERGITIKMAPVRMNYELRTSNLERQTSSQFTVQSSQLSDSKQKYILNLIDTPGHSDFAYEVSRALEAVEGVVLLVDATQGVQAQTLANFESARKSKLVMIGAVNKIDAASPEQIENSVKELAGLLEVSSEEILRVSGKTGEGVEKLLSVIVERIPSPKVRSEFGVLSSGLGRALVFDSFYDEHKGVIAFVRVFDGEFSIQGAPNFYLLATKTEFKPKEIGYFIPQYKSSGIIHRGEIGYIATGIKDPGKLKIGDTIFSDIQHLTSNLQPLAGYLEPKPVVFVSFYPEDTSKYDELKQALAKLRLTDSALQFESDFSEVLGRGFKGGFLGRLHFEITAERLEREFNVSTVTSFPSVAYKVHTKDGWQEIKHPRDFPAEYLEASEPMAKIEILVHPEYLGAILQLKQFFRFRNIETHTLNNKILIKARLPLADLIGDLDDKLKSVSAGYASFSYELADYEKTDVIKLEILLVEQVVPGLTRIIPKEDLEREARAMVEKLKDLLPRQQFSQAIQAAAGGRIIARETLPAMQKALGDFGKNGGDRTRKMKLWKKQQRGKKKLKERATQSQVRIPPQIFKELMRR
ncbi:MAG: elongation factor 4 [Candidatus Harrisonbacteria bacterium RIFCSPLOWO2_02_FULL_41_13b]|uniref:Elongation factor 4 n=1 Tax=Candidatus Harrisonbacteria bacterium RIFCSPLOWO2_02_FULL_41_13b TaxID=1798409 RepID=A0A1G1ZU09_9BACT|nr:MAG: elongation factor 4 [Candidatus Harrisonbacteria bacterium RIFCSPLOWO2_02_FULL_41_13b]